MGKARRKALSAVKAHTRVNENRVNGFTYIHNGCEMRYVWSREKEIFKEENNWGLNERSRNRKKMRNSTATVRVCRPVKGVVISTGVIFVPHLCGFLGQYILLAFENLLFIHASTNATDDHKYSPFPSQILTVPEFWYDLAHSFSLKNVPFDFERAF